MIKLDKTYAHWVVQASLASPRDSHYHANVVINIITADIDRAIAIVHEQYPGAVIHSVIKTHKWDRIGIYIDLPDDLEKITVD